MPTPSKLQPRPSASKTSDLPVGISGPLLRQRRGTGSSYASLQVLLPRFGEKPLNRNIYIGSPSTYTHERFDLALVKAITLREQAEHAYRVDETRARRAAGRELKALLNAARDKAADKAAAKLADRAAKRK